MIFLQQYSKIFALTFLHEVPFMSSSEQEVWLSQASLQGIFLNHDNTSIYWIFTFARLHTKYFIKIISLSYTSAQTFHSPCLQLTTWAQYLHLVVYRYWYSGNSPQFLDRTVSKVNFHVHDLTVLGLPHHEVGQVCL